MNPLHFTRLISRLDACGIASRALKQRVMITCSDWKDRLGVIEDLVGESNHLYFNLCPDSVFWASSSSVECDSNDVWVQTLAPRVGEELSA